MSSVALPQTSQHSLGWIRAAVRSFEDALAEVLADSAPTGDAGEAGRRAALAAVAGQVWSEHLGPLFDTDGVAALLGGVTKQAVSDRVRRRRLLALRTGSGRLVYPAFQFDGRHVLRGLADVLGQIEPDDAEAWTVASWLTTPDPALGGRTPVDALRDGDTDPVLAAAADVAGGLREQ
jgi:hypothetical protein